MRDCPGIYVGKCLVTKKVYVGSSLHALARIKEHKAALRKGIHQNKHLQWAYNKYGYRAFRWKVIVECSTNRNERFIIEQAWIEKLKASDRRYGYNRAYPVRASEPNPTASAKMKEMWGDPEYRELWEACLLKGSRKVSQMLADDPKFAAKISKIRREMWTPEAKALASKKAKKRYSSPEYREEHLDYLAVGRDALKAKRKDPKFVANQVKGMVDRWKDPEARKLQAQRMAALWDNPEFRSKQLARASKQIRAYNEQRARIRDSLNNSE